MMALSVVVFQSTRPHGARLLEAGHCSLLVWVSIHAPTRGATGLVERVGAEVAVSIHAPTRGATLAVETILAEVKRFNPRAHTGRDALLTVGTVPVMVFQSTRPHGARRRSPRTKV